MLIDLGTLNGSADSIGYGINSFGDVVGYSGPDAFFYSNGVMTGLGAGVAFGINDSGQVVGGSNFGAFLYRNGMMADLNTMIDPTRGIQLQTATGINDRGQIIVNGVDANGNVAAFLLTPESLSIPEPSVPLLIAGGLSALAMLHHKRSR